MSPIARLFDRRIRGFRVIEVAALICLVALIFWVYWAKAEAAGERAQIAAIEARIVAAQNELKLLRAEAAHLEQPARIEALSEAHLGLAPVSARREAPADGLIEIARHGGEAPR